MKPAWLIDEYASIRLRCLHDREHRADDEREHPRHPDRRSPVVAPVGQRRTTSTRSIAANAATLPPTP
jgi:hypothetical protein